MKRAIAIAAVAFALAPLASAAPKESVHLIVTGGPNAGTWESSSDKGGCTVGFAGAGSWGNQLSNPKDKDPKHFNSLQLIVPDGKGAAAGAKEFYISFGWGSLLARSAEYKIETRAGQAHKGSGVVTVQDKGTTAKVLFDVKSTEGYRFNGTIDCASVMRAQ